MKRIATLIAIAALCALSILANAADRTSGTVDMAYKLTTSDGSQTIKAKIYFTKNKSRVESSEMPGMPPQQDLTQGKYIVIIDDVKMVGYAIIPGMDYAMRYKLSTTPFGNGNLAGNPTEALDARRYPLGAKIRQTGKKTYKGKTVSVYKADYTIRGTATSSTIYADANTLPLFITGKVGGSQYEITFSNYRFGTQKASLFELPKGLRVMDMSQYEGAMGQK
jgi:hypothetical protein